MSYFYKTYDNNDYDANSISSSGLPHFWFWGLGDDGNLYYRSSEFANQDRWHEYKRLAGATLTIGDMKKIVKEFGHLIVFT